MISFVHIFHAALGVVNDAFIRRKLKTAAETERQRVLSSKEQALMVFIVLCVVLCLVWFYIIISR
jgi:hypothetical protein